MSIINQLYDEFKINFDTLHIYNASNILIFSSDKERLQPLLEYLHKYDCRVKDTIIFDNIMGNAAALLAIFSGCREVYSPVGSELAINNFKKFGIKYHIENVVKFIQHPNVTGICPMEKLSINRSPQEFYRLLLNI